MSGLREAIVDALTELSPTAIYGDGTIKIVAEPVADAVLRVLALAEHATDTQQVRKQIAEAIVRTPHVEGQSRPVIDAVMTVVAPIVAARDAAVEQLERLHSWGGLLKLLDEHWPTDIFPVTETINAAKSQERRDTGPVVLGLIRWVDRLSADLAAARQQLDQVREGIAQAIEKHAEEQGDPADNAYEYARIARQFDAPARTEVTEVNSARHDESGQST